MSDTSNERKSVDLSSKQIQILETRKELIEKTSQEIHLAWRIIPSILYFICAITGYSTSILFHIFWHDIFSDNCPLWAHVTLPPHLRVFEMSRFSGPKDEALIGIVLEDWRRNLIITHEYEYNCKFYHAICLCSCSFGVVWCLLFTYCATGIYAAQWLIIPPALIFQIVFTIIVINTIHDFESGYTSFVYELGTIAHLFMNDTQITKYTKKCELVEYYLEAYNIHSHRTCNVHIALQTLSWIMTLSWIGGLFLLILRIIVLNDFRLRKTTIYRAPVGENIPITVDEIMIEAQPKERRFFFRIFRHRKN